MSTEIFAPKFIIKSLLRHAGAIQLRELDEIQNILIKIFTEVFPEIESSSPALEKAIKNIIGVWCGGIRFNGGFYLTVKDKFFKNFQKKLELGKTAGDITAKNVFSSNHASQILFKLSRRRDNYYGKATTIASIESNLRTIIEDKTMLQIRFHKNDIISVLEEMDIRVSDIAPPPRPRTSVNGARVTLMCLNDFLTKLKKDTKVFEAIKMFYGAE